MRWLTGSDVVSQDKIVLVTAVIRDVCACTASLCMRYGRKASSLPVEYDRGHSDVGNSFHPCVCMDVYLQCLHSYAIHSYPRGPHFHGRVPILPGKWGSGVPISMGSPKFYDTGIMLECFVPYRKPTRTLC